MPLWSLRFTPPVFYCTSVVLQNVEKLVVQDIIQYWYIVSQFFNCVVSFSIFHLLCGSHDQPMCHRAYFTFKGPTSFVHERWNGGNTSFLNMKKKKKKTIFILLHIVRLCLLPCFIVAPYTRRAQYCLFWLHFGITCCLSTQALLPFLAFTLLL